MQLPCADSVGWRSAESSLGMERFGTDGLPESAAASQAQIEAWFDAAIDATTLEAVFAPRS